MKTMTGDKEAVRGRERIGARSPMGAWSGAPYRSWAAEAWGKRLLPWEDLPSVCVDLSSRAR